MFFFRSDYLDKPRNFTSVPVVVALINKVKSAIPATWRRTRS